MATISHCDVVVFSVQNVGEGIDTDLGITAALDSVGASLACAADDPAPGCAGKAAGAAPDLVADRRSILYHRPQLPGQMASTAASLGLQRHDLSSTRPTDRRADSVTMAATPGQDSERHVTAATFTTAFPQPRPLGGAANALLYVAAPQPASVRVRLWGDGVLLSQSTRPASAGAVCPVCRRAAFRPRCTSRSRSQRVTDGQVSWTRVPDRSNPYHGVVPLGATLDGSGDDALSARALDGQSVLVEGLDGVDGDILWTRQVPLVTVREPSIGRESKVTTNADLGGDGRTDVVVKGVTREGEKSLPRVALSGRNGALLWRR